MLAEGAVLSSGMEPPKKSAMAGLPDDLLVEILSRLPVKELHRSKAQVVGWPPIRSYRKNTMAMNQPTLKTKDDGEAKQALVQDCLYVKLSMDGAPYLRKVDLKMYKNYKDLSLALEKMFSCFTVGHNESNGKSGREGLSDCRLMDHKNGTELVLTYKDKDGDWMLVGDVPWRMFTGSCRRLRIMKGSDAVGLAPRVSDKSKNG